MVKMTRAIAAMTVSLPLILMILNQLETILSSDGMIGSPRLKILRALAMIQAKKIAEVVPKASQ